jgi:hypothetical protein
MQITDLVADPASMRMDDVKFCMVYILPLTQVINFILRLFDYFRIL